MLTRYKNEWTLSVTSTVATVTAIASSVSTVVFGTTYISCILGLSLNFSRFIALLRSVILLRLCILSFFLLRFFGCFSLSDFLMNLHMFLLRSKSFFSFNHSFDTVVHILYELCLASAESSLVTNVIDVVVSLSVLAVRSSDLDEESVCNLLELLFVLTE